MITTKDFERWLERIQKLPGKNYKLDPLINFLMMILPKFRMPLKMAIELSTPPVPEIRYHPDCIFQNKASFFCL